MRRVLTERQPVARVAGDFGVSDRTVRNRPTPPELAARLVALRRKRWTGTRIAAALGVLSATVGRILRRHGLSRARDLEPAEPVRRHERARPGELIRLDIKKLGRFERTGHRITGDRRGQSSSRGLGWEVVHVAVDDHSRLACSQIEPDETAASAVAALPFYRRPGVAVERVMTLLRLHS